MFSAVNLVTRVVSSSRRTAIVVATNQVKNQINFPSIQNKHNIYCNLSNCKCQSASCIGISSRFIHTSKTCAADKSERDSKRRVERTSGIIGGRINVNSIINEALDSKMVFKGRTKHAEDPSLLGMLQRDVVSGSKESDQEQVIVESFETATRQQAETYADKEDTDTPKVERKEPDTYEYVSRPVILFDEHVHNRTRYHDYYFPQIPTAEQFWKVGAKRQEEVYNEYMKNRVKPGVTSWLASKWGLDVDFIRRIIKIEHANKNPMQIEADTKTAHLKKYLADLQKQVDRDVIKKAIVPMDIHSRNRWKTVDNPFLVDDDAIDKQMPQPIYIKDCGHIPAYKVLDQEEMIKYNQSLTDAKEPPIEHFKDYELFDYTSYHRNIYDYDDGEHRRHNPRRLVFVDNSWTNERGKMMVYEEINKKRRAVENYDEYKIRKKFIEPKRRSRLLW